MTGRKQVAPNIGFECGSRYSCEEMFVTMKDGRTFTIYAVFGLEQRGKKLIVDHGLSAITKLHIPLMESWEFVEKK